MGFSLVWGGTGAIVWGDYTSQFPYRSGKFLNSENDKKNKSGHPPSLYNSSLTGVVPIVISWIISPILASIVAAILFILNKYERFYGQMTFLTISYDEFCIMPCIIRHCTYTLG